MRRFTFHQKAGRSVALLAAVLALSLLLSSFPAPLHAQNEADSAGTIAYVGNDDNIYLLDSPGAPPLALTDDARRGGIRRYAWPTWSTDGRLAFFGRERRESGDISLEVFILPPNTQTPLLAYESDQETLTYAYWAPANCPVNPHCRDLAVLTTTSTGLSLLRIRDEVPTFTAESLGLGGPFYYSYSPDASQMIWQRFGTELALYDTTSDAIIEHLPDTVGVFQAPMWSPVDNRLLFSVFDDSERHNLVIAEGEERRIIAADQQGTLWFSWSPDGQYVAYKTNQGILHIVDAASGDEVTRSNFSRVAAFFWSPDSQRIAYLTMPRNGNTPQVHLPGGISGLLAAPARQDTRPMLSWHIIDLAEESEQAHGERFAPTEAMLYLVAFFDQFTQSHRIWSPDSRYLIYGEQPERGAPLIRILNAADPDAEVVTLAEGRIGIWSFQ